VRCSCGEQVFIAPSLSARCPQCGRRLFWKCQCGTLVERIVSRCPNCGTERERRNAKAYPRLRLRGILGAGLTGAFVFGLLGYYSHKALSKLSSSEIGNQTSPSSHQGDNVVVLTLKGILLLFGDLIGAIGRVVRENPMVCALAVLGFIVAIVFSSKQQQLTLKRLKRHLRRKWEQWTSR